MDQRLFHENCQNLSWKISISHFERHILIAEMKNQRAGKNVAGNKVNERILWQVESIIIGPRSFSRNNTENHWNVPFEVRAHICTRVLHCFLVSQHVKVQSDLPKVQSVSDFIKIQFSMFRRDKAQNYYITLSTIPFQRKLFRVFQTLKPNNTNTRCLLRKFFF